MLSGETAMSRAGFSRHSESMIEEAYCGTWFAVEGAPGVGVPTIGTCPGTQLADLMFNLSILASLETIEAKFKLAGLHIEVKYSGKREVPEAGTTMEQLLHRASLLETAAGKIKIRQVA